LEDDGIKNMHINPSILPRRRNMTYKQQQYLHDHTTQYGYYEEEKKLIAKFLPTRNYVNGEWIEFYNSILEAWMDTERYSQASTGLNNNRRDVIVLDLDKGIENLCIPVTYLFQNPETGHYQAGLVLDEPTYDLKRNLILTQKLNELCNGDPEYKAWMCKNPFHFVTEWTSLIFNFEELYKEYVCQEEVRSKEEKKNDRLKSMTKLTPQSEEIHLVKNVEEKNISMKEIQELSVDFMVKNVRFTLNDKLSENTSRHNHIMKNTNRYVWCNKARVTLEQTIEFLLSINEQIAKKCNKPPEKETEVIYQVKSLYPWAMEKYDPEKAKYLFSIENIEAWREAGLTIRREIRDHKIEKLHELLTDFCVKGSYRYIQSKMLEIFDIKVSLGWLATYIPLFKSEDQEISEEPKNSPSSSLLNLIIILNCVYIKQFILTNYFIFWILKAKLRKKMAVFRC
jgi:hypothetical protein